MCSYRGDIGNLTGADQPQTGHLGQRSPAVVAAQVGDVGNGEGYDGLTPVTITL